MHKKILIFIFVSIFIFKLNGQDANQFYKYKRALGINVTNILGNVFSLNPSNTTSPYSISFRKMGTKGGLRTGLDFLYKTSEGSSFSTISASNIQGQMLASIGYEWYLPIQKRFLFAYGFDVLGSFRRDKTVSSAVDTNFNVITFTSNLTGFSVGSGPVLRFEFKVSDRMYLSTESSLYVIYSQSSRKFDDGLISSTDFKSKSLNAELALPQTLFIQIAF